MSARTTYVTARSGARLGMTPTNPGDHDEQHVLVTTKTASLGFFRLERAGADPLTGSGALKASAAQTLADYLFPPA